MNRKIAKALLLSFIICLGLITKAPYSFAEEIIVSGAKTYEDGQYKAGKDIAAGEYILFSNSTNGTYAYFCISTDSNQDDIVENENFEYNSIITITDGQYLELHKCYAVAFDDVESLDLSGTGMFKVGTHLLAGEYKLIADTDLYGYYGIYSDSGSREIISNKNFEGSVYITLEDGQYLSNNHCYIDNPQAVNDSGENDSDDSFSSDSEYFNVNDYIKRVNKIAEDYGFSLSQYSTDEETIYYTIEYDEVFQDALVAVDFDSKTENITSATILGDEDTDTSMMMYMVMFLTMAADESLDFSDAKDLWSDVLNSDNYMKEQNGLKYYFTVLDSKTSMFYISFSK